MAQRSIRAVFMRGGTSKAVFFREEDLPTDPVVRDQVILTAYGSPDPYGRQVDGMGGSFSTTSKVAIIKRSEHPGVDVDYMFGQVGIRQYLIDRKGNCGNISSAVGPFVVDEGLVEVREPVTDVRIYNTNTQKMIVSHVPVENGHAKVEGDYEIAGVPMLGAKIVLDFMEPGGSVTGDLLPTGHARDTVDVPGVGKVDISIVDAANPLIFVQADKIGLDGMEQGDRVDGDEELKARVEAVRGTAAVLVGLAKDLEDAKLHSPAVPKMTWVAPPASYRTSGGVEISAESIDLIGRMMSMGTLHRAYALTGAICTSLAAGIPGTVVNEVVRRAGEVSPDRVARTVMIGHPAGRIDTGVELERREGIWHAVKASGGRTARRLMEGRVLIPEDAFGRDAFDAVSRRAAV